MAVRHHLPLLLLTVAFWFAAVQAQVPLTILTPPGDQTSRNDTTAAVVFSISIMGGLDDLTFEWKRGLQLLEPPTIKQRTGTSRVDATFSLRPGIGGFFPLAGSYSCVVTDQSFPTAQTVTATFNFAVTVPPRITQPPANVTANVTTTVTFSCAASGTPPPIYQWLENGVPLAGQTQQTLTLQLSDISRNGRGYACQASNSATFVTATAFLNIISSVPYFTQPLASTVDVNYGAPLTLSCQARGIPGVQYSWNRRLSIETADMVVVGATTSSLAVNTTFNSIYSCIATNIIGSNKSSSLVNVVTALPTNQLMARSFRFYAGYPMKIECQSSGIPKPTVSWLFTQSGYHHNVSLPSMDNKLYYKPVAEKSDQGLYYCVAGNVAGSTAGASSAYVIIDTINPPPNFPFTQLTGMTTVPASLPTIPGQITTQAAIHTIPPTTDQGRPLTGTSSVSSGTSRDDTGTAGQATVPASAATPVGVTMGTGFPVGTGTSSSVAPANSTDSLFPLPNTDSQDTNNVVVIVVPILVGIIVIAVVVIFVILYLSHNRTHPKDRRGAKKSLTQNEVAPAIDDATGPELEMDVITNPQFEQGSAQQESTAATGGYTLVTLKEALTRVEAAIASGERTNELVAEYEGVPLNMVSVEESPSAHGTEHKNRYMNVLPNPQTAVRLAEDPPGDAVSTYINANYVKDYAGNDRAFIATQGPTADTMNDFWRMVWENNVSVVVMVTQLVERGRAKCMRYWPDAESSQDYGKYTVNVDDVTDHPDYLLTTMSIFLTEDGDDEGAAGDAIVRTVRHFWFKGWPDFGIPLHTEPVLEFLKTVDDVNMDKHAPVIIHCSAGIGRTGTLVAAWMGMQQYEAQQVVNPLSYLDSVRQSRGGCIQTFDQYLFLHRALLTYMVQVERVLAADDVQAAQDAQAAEEEVEAIENQQSDTQLI